MTAPSDRRVSVPEPALKAFCRALLEQVGVPPSDAELVADNLVVADLRGVESHGVVRLPIYIERILAGGTDPRPRISVMRRTRTTAVLDGGNGLGHLVGVRAMDLALEMAADGDCAFVAVRNSNHFGAAAYYTEMAAARDMVGLAFTIGAINHMAPWGGVDPILGNNPFSIAFPTGGAFPIVLDMACSNAARGKIIVAAKDGTPIPPDWATGADGHPTTDPVEALKGLVLPIGGAKGYALTLTVGLLSTMLSGGAFGSEMSHMYEEPGTAQNVGHLFGVLPVAAFEDPEHYRARMAKAIADIKGVRRAEGVETIYLPGEREHLALLRNRANGIPVNRAVVEELRMLGARHGVTLDATADAVSA